MDCRSCQAPLPGGAHYCPACGAAAAEHPADAAQRFAKDGAVPGKRARRLLQSLEYLPAAIALFDESGRVYAYNQTMIEYHPELAGVIEGGVTFEEVIRASYRVGAVHLDMPLDEMVRQRLERFRHPQGPLVAQRTDGRWLRAVDHKTPDGWTVSIRVDISNLKQLEAELRASEAQLRKITDSVQALIAYVDAERRFRFVNRRYAAMVGLPPETIHGERVEDIWRDIPEEEIMPAVHKALAGEEVTYELNIPDARGGRRFHEARYIPDVEDGQVQGYFIVGTDITERRLKAQQLALSEEKYRSLVEGSIQGLFVHRDFGILFVNDALASLLGYPSSEALMALGSTLDWVAPEDVEQIKAYARRRYAGEAPPERYEHRVKRMDGSILWVESRSTRITWTDGPATQTVFVDITERKLAEEMRESFISMVSHELKTPITSIMGAITALQTVVAPENENPEEAELLDVVTRNSSRLLRLVEDVLDLQRLESGHLQVAIERLDAGFAAAQAVEGSGWLARAHGVTIAADIAEGCWVMGDPDRLNQILMNYISNAAKYTARGDTVTVSAGLRDGMVRLGVVDHGPGIPQDFAGRVFGRFQQVDKALSRSKGGTGLGLNITKSLVERMGGRIGFRSQPNVETEFFAEFPLAAEAEQPADARREA